MIGQYDRVAVPSFPVFWPHDRVDRSYNNLLLKQGSFLVRCGLQNISNSRTVRLLDPASVSRGQLKQKDILFLGKRIATPSFATPIRLGTTVRILFPSLSPLPIRLSFYCFLVLLAPWPTLLCPILLLPALGRSTTTTLGTTLRRRVP